MFILPDLVIESVIRDGFENVRRDLSIIDDIFASFTQAHLTPKYGAAEIAKIKNFVANKEVGVVNAFSQVNANLPCISIQLLDDVEDQAHNFMDDFEEDLRLPLSEEEEAALIVLENIIPEYYDINSGSIGIPDSIDLSPIYANLLFVDANGNEFPIVGSINNTVGTKSIGVLKGSNVIISDLCHIKSSLNYKQYEKRGTIETEKLLIGIHTEERLVTIYLYQLIKYFLLSRKPDLISRGFQKSTFSGSDFTRNLEYGEPVFDRFITATGLIQNSWLSDKVELIDNIDVGVLVEKDVASTEDLGLEDSTIQIAEK
jgi:hypothetical protein